MGQFFADVWQGISTFFVNAWHAVYAFLGSVNIITSIIDIAVVTLLFYFVIILIRDTKAKQLVKGLLLLVLMYVVAQVLDLQAFSFIMDIFLANALIILVVIFQPELRRVLERAGRTKWGEVILRFSSSGDDAMKNERIEEVVDAVCEAFEVLQKDKMGALVVFERNTPLGDVIRTGTIVDAAPSSELIKNIFFNKAALHDGAVVIHDARVYAAGCILPLTENTHLSSSLGTRHRSGLGMSEQSDAIVLILSEETGNVSLAVSGVLKQNYTLESIREAILKYLLPDVAEVNMKSIFQRRAKK